jgi:hypothetical protein
MLYGMNVNINIYFLEVIMIAGLIFEVFVFLNAWQQLRNLVNICMMFEFLMLANFSSMISIDLHFIVLYPLETIKLNN